MHTMSKLLCALSLLASTAAVAGVAKQNHHCKLTDGTMDMAKTKRECKAAKGTWAKEAPGAAMPAADAPVAK